ncbi:MlaD family protein [Cocleimonas flava]|uniref:Paraquat-inducible protein B n=1 Tax=Cocleimonas flava TaxID=634765 RepID=A0A4R1F5A8_9GAMM|nr:MULTISPECIES: MlaD family protein [Cocleimonas]MEB8430884.1 MlaD family protein [Cocleimonas sp. KMM 6892]MEC4714344.1 MlaD family protein [Cocleimonas sp. KMM 6895]MEC4743675.1 MlaD family protein [Cocleimonas sp. KMM 6896]TCJ88580.1 paraquat-inducible protein B [Cocleimonas flava]
MAHTEPNLDNGINPDELPFAQVNPKARFSLIWIIPLTAALIGGWLIYKYYSERGTIINITFDEAAGIEEKKTPIRYKDVVVGKVRRLRLTEDLNKVRVTAEIYPEMAENLGTNTRFWVKKPRITLQGVSGLDTLLSGVYIGLDPGAKSEPLDNYLGLSTAPFITNDASGTRIAMRTENLGSLDIGSPVYYNKINVGEVTSYRLNSDTESIDVFIYVHEPYDKLIKSNTRFWNASGIEVDITATGISTRMESMTSLLIGGIAFETPKDGVSKEISGENAFTLYDSYKVAQENTELYNKLFYTMYFDDSLHGLTEDSSIEYSGVKVGRVEKISLQHDAANDNIKAAVKVSLRIDKFSNKADAKEAEEKLQSLVEEGLQAQLVVDSLLTGSQYISLHVPPSRLITGEKGRNEFALMPTSIKKASRFPTTAAQSTLMNFDATEISEALTDTLSSVKALINSDDIKKTLNGLANTTANLDRITSQLDKEGFSKELVNTLASAKKTTESINRLMLDAQKAVVTITSATDKLQKDAGHTLQTFSNVGNKLEQNAAKTMQSINRTSNTLDAGLKSTLSEDSALQHRLQVLINELTEASRSFSVLADTLQRKPDSLIFGK